MLFALIGGVAVALIAGLGYLVVRASLRPLGQLERTAAAIAGGDLTQRVPPIDPRTEIGQLSTALNRMLAEIEVAFANGRPQRRRRPGGPSGRCGPRRPPPGGPRTQCGR